MRSTFEYEIESEQLLAALKFNQRRLMRQPPIRKAVMAFGLLHAGLWAVIGFAVMSLVREAWIWMLALGGGMILIGLQQFLVQRAIYRYLAGSAGRKLGRWTLRCEDSGLHLTTADSESLIAWSGICAVEETGALILLYCDGLRWLSANNELDSEVAAGRQARAQLNGGAAAR